jgi:tetratricopeptide (TPR) repeat protein
MERRPPAGWPGGLRPPLLVVLLLLFATCHREAPQPHILFIGLDGADWHYLDARMVDGTMPHLAQLVREGDRRVLLTQHPPLSPLVWTTMMTGVSPLEHRILDFTRFNPITHTREPITSDERAVPAIWNMASSRGQRVDVFAMWATYPPETGVVLTDRDASLHAKSASSAADAVSRVFAETEHIHETAMQTIARDHPNLAIVYFEGTDAIGHLLSGRDDGTARRYFARIDAMLGDDIELAERENATIVIASDHGFDWNGAHAEASSTNAVTAAQWHRDEGIFVIWPRAPHREVKGVGDITPLLLDLLHLPTDVREYRRGYKPPAPVAANTGNEELAKLTALGYINATDAAHGSGTRTAGSYNNEALILRGEHRDDEAAAALENALRVDPKNAAALWNLSDLLRHRDAKRAGALLDAAIDADPHQPRWLLTRGRYALERHDCRAARADFERATALAPNDAIAFASLGTAAACLGDDKAADAAFRKSLEIDPNQPQLARLLGARP